jgi:hypothetical protein
MPVSLFVCGAVADAALTCSMGSIPSSLFWDSLEFLGTLGFSTVSGVNQGWQLRAGTLEADSSSRFKAGYRACG